MTSRLTVCSMVCAGALLCASAASADELHLRDGTIIVGAYVGGTQKEVYFQRTPAGSDMYPVFMVESVKFNPAPGLPPGASAPRPGRSFTEVWTGQLKWVFAIFFPPAPAAQLARSTH
jgi:hypothetical protein